MEILPGGALKSLAHWPWPIGRIFADMLFGRAQRRAEYLHSRARRDLMRLDRQLGILFSFSGHME